MSGTVAGLKGSEGGCKGWTWEGCWGCSPQGGRTGQAINCLGPGISARPSRGQGLLADLHRSEARLGSSACGSSTHKQRSWPAESLTGAAPAADSLREPGGPPLNPVMSTSWVRHAVSCYDVLAHAAASA